VIRRILSWFSALFASSPDPSRPESLPLLRCSTCVDCFSDIHKPPCLGCYTERELPNWRADL
jgi:hypothetical protein